MLHKILHLCTDGNFIDNSISVFNHFYPNQNVFYIKPKIGCEKIVYVKSKDAICFNPYKSNTYLEDIDSLDKKECFDIIVVHGMSEHFNKILRQINSNKNKKVFWIFWGYELYYSLGEKGVYPLIDDVSPFSIMSWITPTKYNCFERWLFRKGLFHKWLEEFLPFVDFFCFWLYEDYLLLKRFYPQYIIQYRHFQYGASWKVEKESDVSIEFEKNELEIRIGHQASKTANHKTVMKLLKQIDQNNEYKKIVPLAYGSKYVKNQVIKIGKKYFGSQFIPIVDFVNSEEYYRSLEKTSVAFFGQLRQEAGGNIFPLIQRGAKVFLRKSNPLYIHCIKSGYAVFSIEDDLKSIDDLKPLTREQMIHNANKSRNNQVFYEDFMPCLFDD